MIRLLLLAALSSAGPLRPPPAASAELVAVRTLALSPEQPPALERVAVHALPPAPESIVTPVPASAVVEPALTPSPTVQKRADAPRKPRARTLIHVEEVRTEGTPDAEAWLSALTRIDLAAALWSATCKT